MNELSDNLGDRVRITFAVLLLCGLLGALRWHTVDEPLERDLTTYAVIAREMLHGRPLYADLWDHKPPAIHFSYAAAQLVAGPGPISIWLLAVVTGSVTLIGIYRCSATVGLPGAGLLAATFWSIASGDLRHEGNQPNVEAFLNACVVWVLALVLVGTRETVATKRWLAVGGLISLATLFKQVAVVPAMTILAAHWGLMSLAAVARPRIWRQLSLVAIAGAAGLVLATLGLILWGVATPAWHAVVTFNQDYAGSIWHNLARAFERDHFAPR